jgi:hypothetical protein
MVGKYSNLQKQEQKHKKNQLVKRTTTTTTTKERLKNSHIWTKKKNPKPSANMP